MIINPNNILRALLSNRLGRSATQLELKPRIKTSQSNLPVLSHREKEAINNFWKPIGADIIDYSYWKFYKLLMGGRFNESIVPDNIYWARLIRVLNPVSLTRTYINKNLYPILFKGLRQPNILVNVINGVFYDCSMNRISFEKSACILCNSESDIIIKPTNATSGGAGVVKIHTGTSKGAIEQILAKYGNNYICQETVKQSKSTAIFNKSSLNTFRINTLNINGNTTCECVMMRHGINGSVIDNFAAGGIVCGMDKTGKFNGVNFNNKLHPVERLHDGSYYQNHVIDAIGDAVTAAIEAHQRFMPHIGHAAWDFAIDENEKPVMIEVNLMLPGIMMEQLTSGSSIFGNRTEEVIAYALDKNKFLPWTEFVGGW